MTVHTAPDAASASPLVQPMFEGPVDVIGDIHGEIEALANLLHHLGYSLDGSHPEGRRLIFVGDLVDRGPDSPAVVELVMQIVAAGRAQCVLGNHELNLLRGKLEFYNYWFHGEVPAKPESQQALLPANRREDVLAFFRSLPVALERSDLRVVHACWDDAAIEQIKHCTDATQQFHHWQNLLKARADAEAITDKTEHNLLLQNGNPIKLITSGPERRAPAPFEAGGKIRHEARHPWWNDYTADAFCVCGHYWRVPLPNKCSDSLFNGCGLSDPLGSGRVMCIDYSVGGRWLERKTKQSFGAHLAALRWPEGALVYDDAHDCASTAAGGSFGFRR
jgi:hypothetical protein